MPEPTSTQEAGATPRQSLDLDAALAAAATYRHGQDRGAFYALEQRVRDETAAGLGQASEPNTPLGDRLADLLEADATVEAKGLFCRLLSIVGSHKHAPALARRLADPPLSFMARYALERIPGPRVDRILREALNRTTGPLKIGVINSIGHRQDREAVPLLIALLEEADLEIVAAAGAALGGIGTPAAKDALARRMASATGPTKCVLADAYLACGGRSDSTRPE